MKCERCGKEATVHDQKVVKGKIISQSHLCEQCAQNEGSAEKQSFQTLGELVSASIAKQAGLPSAARRAATTGGCMSCGLTWAEFRERGLFGCPACYDVFEDQIGPLLERAHERGTHHVGKRPSGLADDADQAVRVRHLRDKLAQAIALEQYERAAALRDELTGLGVSLRSVEATSPRESGAT